MCFFHRHPFYTLRFLPLATLLLSATPSRFFLLPPKRLTSSTPHRFVCRRQSRCCPCALIPATFYGLSHGLVFSSFGVWTSSTGFIGAYITSLICKNKNKKTPACV